MCVSLNYTLNVIFHKLFPPQNLTEFNTAHNRRITMLGIDDDDARPRKRHKYNISFKVFAVIQYTKY